MTDSANNSNNFDDLLKRARATKLLAEAAEIKNRGGDFVPLAEHKKALEEQKAAIFAEIWEHLSELPRAFYKAGLIKKNEISRAAKVLGDILK